MRVASFLDPPSFLRGLTGLFQQGLSPRDLLFLALDSHGVVHVALPDRLGESALRVGEKLTLTWPGPEADRLYHFDSVHVLRDGFYVFNGDRRLKNPGDAIEVGLVMATFLRWCQTQNVFFGCTPHQPGSWLLGGKEVVTLHDFGVVEVLPVPCGLLARRVHDHRLYLLTFEDIARTGHLEGWLPVYAAPLGNILLLERRVVRGRIVLSCERGLVEVNLERLPQVVEVGRLSISVPGPVPGPGSGQVSGQPNGAFAVVGRVDGQSFAVTRGTPRPWGLENLQPAELMGTAALGLQEMKGAILDPGGMVVRAV